MCCGKGKGGYLMEERNYGIDLLRLVLMYMVCIIHVLGQGGILGNLTRGTVDHAVYWFFQSIVCCAVNGFALITGYTATNREQKYEKIANMWFQVFFYSFILTALLKVCGLADVGSKTLIKQLLPVTFDTHWYFTAYVGLFFAMPLLNTFIFSVSPFKAKCTLIIMFVLFCILGMIKDSFRTEYGYSMLWLVVLYVFGALAKRIHLFENLKTSRLLLIIIVSVLINLSVVVFTGLGRQTKFTSPTALCIALILVVLFTRIRMPEKAIRIINHTSKWAFGVYLFQVNYVIWNQVLFNRFSSFTEKSPFIGGLYVMIASGAVFLIGLFTEALRSFLHQRLQIPRLCGFIVGKIRVMIGRITLLIK